MITLLQTILLSLKINLVINNQMADFRENPVYNFNYFTFVITPKDTFYPVDSSNYPSFKIPEQYYDVQVNYFVFIFFYTGPIFFTYFCKPIFLFQKNPALIKETKPKSRQRINISSPGGNPYTVKRNSTNIKM
jgi:hypothetical protein